MTTQSDAYEPPIVQGVLSAAVAIGGLVLAGVGLVLLAWPPEWLTGWGRLATIPAIAYGLLLALRFTRFDRHVATTVATLQMDCEDYEVEVGRLEGLVKAKDDVIAEHVDTIGWLRERLANPNKTLTITDRNGARMIPLYERNDVWRHAMELVRSAGGDFGKLAGHERLGRTQDEQTEALKMLKYVGVAAPRGTIWRLTVVQQHAVDLLNSFALEKAATPPPMVLPPMVRLDVNPDATSYLEPDASGFESGEG
ncbi:MAG: hypothetical protein ACOYD4_06780 [Solirubrobacterales bacterium]